MRADRVIAPTPRPVRRSTTDRVRDAVLALAGGRGEVLHHTETAWASITFAGTRHRLKLGFEGAEAISGGEVLVAALPEHEFTIPRQLVADATITGVANSLLPTQRLVVECELLLLETAPQDRRAG